MTFVHIICLHLYKATSTMHCDFIAVIETESVFHAERKRVDSVIQSLQFIPSLAGEASDMQHLQCGTNSLSKKFAIARRLLLLRGTFKKNFKKSKSFIRHGSSACWNHILTRLQPTSGANVGLKTYYFSRALTAARAWNALPSSVRSAPSLLQFRRDLKTALFQSSYSSP